MVYKLKCPVEELIQWEKDGPWYTFEGELATDEQVHQYLEFKKKLQIKMNEENEEKKTKENMW